MPPFTRPQKPLDKSRLALVTTGGVHLPGQPRFDINDFEGDCSYREIPTDAEDLTWTHAYYRPDEAPTSTPSSPFRPFAGSSKTAWWAS